MIAVGHVVVETASMIEAAHVASKAKLGQCRGVYRGVRYWSLNHYQGNCPCKR